MSSNTEPLLAKYTDIETPVVLQAFSFLSLPGEIRTAIYCYALTSRESVRLGYPHAALSLPYTCRTVYIEAIQLVYCLNSFDYALNDHLAIPTPLPPAERHQITFNFDLFTYIRELTIHLLVDCSTPRDFLVPLTFNKLRQLLSRLKATRPDITINLEPTDETRATRRRVTEQLTDVGFAQGPMLSDWLWSGWTALVAMHLWEAAEAEGLVAIAAWTDSENMICGGWFEWVEPTRGITLYSPGRALTAAGDDGVE